jgi:hypothetical protein
MNRQERAELFREAAEILNPTCVVRGTAEDLDVDERTVRRWIAGTREIPYTVMGAMLENLSIPESRLRRLTEKLWKEQQL